MDFIFTKVDLIKLDVILSNRVLSSKMTDKLITINSEDLEVAKKFKLRNNGSVSKIHGVGIEKEKYVVENFDKSEYRKKLNLENEDFVF